MVSTQTERRQVEYFTYRDGMARVVLAEPLEAAESFLTAVDLLYKYLLEGDRFKLFACGVHKMIPPDSFAQHPEAEVLRVRDEARVAAGELEVGMVTHLGTYHSKTCSKEKFSL